MSKVVVLSDIHSNDVNLQKVLDAASDLGASLVLCAGDLGITNPAIGMVLANRSVPFLAVRGNCDSPWDFIESQIPMPELYLTHAVNGRTVFMTHGDRYWDFEDVGLKHSPSDIIITGHTHVPYLGFDGDVIRLNPGSASRPRGNLRSSYAIIDEHSIRILEIDGNRVTTELYLP